MNALMKMVFSFIWLVAMFALIYMGLLPFGINLFNNEFVMNHQWIIDVVHYIAGIAGVLGLVKFAHKCMGGGSWCHSEKGGCSCGMVNCNCRK